MKVIFFGSFNPIHWGHIDQIEYLLNKNYEVELIISPHNPHKDIKSLMSFDDRVDICKIAIEDTYGEFPISSLNINTIEQYLEKPNYTYLTLRELTKQYSEKPAIAMGVDVVNNLHKWRNYEEIMTYPIVILTRPGYDLDEIISSKLNIIETISGHTDISSSMIRSGMEEGDSLVNLFMTENSFIMYNRIYNINKMINDADK